MDPAELLVLELRSQDSLHLDLVVYRLLDAESVREDP